MGNLVEDTVKEMNVLARESMRTGQLQMNNVVLGWLNRHRLALSQHLIRELVEAMDSALIKAKPLDPTYWPEKAKDRREEFKEEDARSRGEV